MYTINVPVKPYVKKFILARYGLNDHTNWDFSRQDRIGKMFYLLLERMPVLYKKNDLSLGDELKVNICEEYAVRRGVYISNQSISEFNDAVYLEIIESIAMYAFQVKNRLGLKKYDELYIKQTTTAGLKVRVIKDPNLIQFLEKREIIYDILKLYDITEDDLPFETIRKAWQRLKLPLLTA